MNKEKIKELIETGVQLHGHRCPAMPLGIRAGLAALNKLGVEKASNKELFCVLETGPAHAMMCFGDGVQMATGCTFGKGNIIKANLSKLALTLVDVKNRKEVRVNVLPDFQEKGLSSEFVKLRQQGVEPKDIDGKLVDTLISRMLSLEDKEILAIGEVEDSCFMPKKGTFRWDRCSVCGEITFEHGLRVVKGRHVCIPCSEK